MSYRYLAIALAVTAVVAMSPLVAEAQSTDAGQTPRTSWGAPDLGGVWDFRTTTPLERPDELAGKTELTAEEAAAQKARASEFLVDRPPQEGDPGAYNVFWFDTPGLVDDRRTSLITDPPDGKLPPLTPNAVNQVGSLFEDVAGPLPLRYRAGGSSVSILH